jgi:hypothetical protein
MLYGLLVRVGKKMYTPKMVMKHTLKEIYEEAIRISEEIYKERPSALIETIVSKQKD